VEMSESWLLALTLLDISLAKMLPTSHRNGGYLDENPRKEEKGERDNSREHNEIGGESRPNLMGNIYLAREE